VKITTEVRLSQIRAIPCQEL